MRQTCKKDNLRDLCPMCCGEIKRSQQCLYRAGHWDPPIREMDFTVNEGKAPGIQKSGTNAYQVRTHETIAASSAHKKSKGEKTSFSHFMFDCVKKKLDATTKRLKKTDKELSAIKRSVVMLQRSPLPLMSTETRPLVKVLHDAVGYRAGNERSLQDGPVCIITNTVTDCAGSSVVLDIVRM